MAHVATPALAVKICGLRELDNIAEITALGPAFVGLIFAPRSKRCVGDDLDPDAMAALWASLDAAQRPRKVGVFVNQSEAEIAARVATYQLDGVQLHGDETPAFCGMLGEQLPGVFVSKAFGVDADFDLGRLAEYADVCEHFVLDTRTPAYGGSGETFDWSLLASYPARCQVPFLLAGGLGPDNIDDVLKWREDIEEHELSRLIMGVDINSKAEVAPGRKDVAAVDAVIQRVNVANHV